MPFSGTGVFNRLYSWASDAAANLKISSSRMDAEFNGIATGLTNCMTRDGQSPATANIPMGGFKLTGLANATLSTDALPYGQADGRYQPLGSYAALAGNAAQTFDVANASSGNHAVNRTTGDGRYGQLATTNTWALAQTFTTQPKAPAYGFTIGGSTAYIDADATNVAIKPAVGGKVYIIDTGGTRRTIECANALTSVEVVTLGQADARYRAKADLVFGSITSASIAAGGTYTTDFSTGLGTADIDFGAQIFGSGGSVVASSNVRGFIWGSDGRFVCVGNANGTDPTPFSLSSFSDGLYFSISNNHTSAQTITIKWWARKRV